MWESLKRFWQATRLRHTEAPHIATLASHYTPFAHTSPAQERHAHAYQHSPYVYVAVNRIAESVALVPLQLYQQRGDERVEVLRHPFLDLLNNPNPTTSRFELFEQTIGALELTGNAYWFIAGDASGLPREIWTLRPDRVTIVPDARRYVRGFLYELDGVQIPLDALEVVHFKRWHPNNDYYGLSALSAARLAVENERAMSQWNANTFGRDYGIPAGIVSVRDPIPDSDFDRLKHEWRAAYGSGQRRTAFLRGGSVEWVNVGLNHNDLDFLRGKQLTRDEILHIYGIPLGIMSENATEANATVAERQFIERTLYPKLARVAQRITQELLPFYGEGLTAAFEDIRPRNAQERLAEIGAARGILTVNEIRARYYQLPPLAEGEASATDTTPADEAPSPA